MYTDIHALTEQVLATVEAEEASAKLASAENVDTVKTDIGKQLKKVAMQLREHCSSDITYADLTDTTPVKTAHFDDDPSAVFGKTALSKSLREVAAIIRRTGIEKSAEKKENSARILRAALGLTTLTKGIR